MSADLRRGLQVITSPGEPKRTAGRANLTAAPPEPEADDFDRLLDAEARRVSRIHWSPALVCQRAAELLAPGDQEQVLDVGSGVGKLCVLASAHSQGQYVGVELRAQLVAQARRVAAQQESSARFIHGNAFDLDWTGFQALYFYNPFDEARFSAACQIDESIPNGAALFEELVERTQTRLATLAPGTRVVTFHGIGGPMPGCYQLLSSERLADGPLELWCRAQPGPCPP